MSDITKAQLSSLLEVIHREHGYDFRLYSEAHILRRISNRLALSAVENVGELKDRILRDKDFASLLIRDLSISVTEMFRDPDFYRSVRALAVPVLKTYPFVKIWHAGCSTGEEAYSMAVVLKEEGLYDRSTIYATDFNQHALNRAKEGIFSNKTVKDYTLNYQKAGGTAAFSDYYTSNYDNVIMDRSLKRNIVFASHNLVTDSVFSEVHMVLCRNVLIYFKPELQNKAHKLFHDSLINGGILCLGSKESLGLSGFADKYMEMDKKQRMFRKKYSP